MPKKPRREDQAAIDMVTVGTFLMVSCSTYQALDLIEDTAEKVKKTAEDVTDAAGNVIDDVVDRTRRQIDTMQGITSNVVNYGPLGVFLGKSDKDELARLARALGKGRKGGIL